MVNGMIFNTLEEAASAGYSEAWVIGQYLLGQPED